MDDQRDRALALYAAGMRDREPVRDADLQGLQDAFAPLWTPPLHLGLVFEEVQCLRNEVARLHDGVDRLRNAVAIMEDEKAALQDQIDEEGHI